MAVGSSLQNIGQQSGGFGQGLKNFLVGSPSGIAQINRFNPGQQQGLQQILQQALSGIGNRQPVDFAPIAQQYKNQFNQETIPGIAQRFSGLDAQRSSAFGQQLGAAGADLNSNLAALQSQFGLQQQGQNDAFLQNLLGLGLQPQNENFSVQGQEGALQGVLKQLPQLLALYFSGGLSGLGNIGNKG